MNPLINVRNLPSAPTPTKAYKSNDYQVCIEGTVIYKPESMLHVSNMDKAITAQSRENGRKAQLEKAHENWERMAKMAGDGWSDREIAEAVGYTEKYVRERLKRMRRSGIKIPERQRGRKANG